MMPKDGSSYSTSRGKEGNKENMMAREIPVADPIVLDGVPEVHNRNGQQGDRNKKRRKKSMVMVLAIVAIILIVALAVAVGYILWGKRSAPVNDEVPPAQTMFQGIATDTIRCTDTIIGETRRDGNVLIGSSSCSGDFTTDTIKGKLFTFVGTGGCVEISTCNEQTLFDTRIRVYETNGEDLTCISSNNDAVQECSMYPLLSVVKFESILGKLYVIMVDGAMEADDGVFALSIKCDSCLPSTPEAAYSSVPSGAAVSTHSTIKANLQSDDIFGSVVSLSYDGSRIAVYAEGYGVVQVYDRKDDEEWVQVGSDIPSMTRRNGSEDEPSMILSGDGTTLALISDNDITGDGTFQEFVMVYRWNGSQWYLLDSTVDGRSLDSVSLSYTGDVLAVGSCLYLSNGEVGGVTVYDIYENSMEQQGEVIYGEYDDDCFGHSVSLSGSGKKLAVGSWLNEDGGIRSGRVRNFELGDWGWMKRGNDIDGEGAAARLGMSLQMSYDGETFAVGAPTKYGGKGAVQILKYDYISNDWRQVGQEIVGDRADWGYSSGSQLGRTISLSNDGTRVVTGGPNSLEQKSIFKVFQVLTNGDWIQWGNNVYIEDSNRRSNWISISGNGKYVAAGAPHNGDTYGEVFIFAINH